MDNSSNVKQKLVYVLKSMKLRLFLIILITGATLLVLLGVSAYSASSMEAVSIRTDTVEDYVSKVSTKILNTAYLSNPANSPDITKELDIAAELYDGRIIVIDRRMTIVYDSYGMEKDKTLISKEAIKAIRGSQSQYRDTVRNTIELTIPITDVSSDSAESGNGAIIISYSLESSSQLVETIKKRLILVGVIEAIILLTICVVASSEITRPFRDISKSIQHVSEGYITDKVDIRGFSEMTAISDSFNEMLGRLASIEDSRQEFVSNVSHELKTPITSIKVLADSLINQPDVPVELYREFLTDINAEIDRENSIINELLALVKLDRKTGDLHIAEVSINELVEIILKRLQPIAGTNGIELIYESYRDVVAEVDEVKLSLALTNLIENGIKYNRENGWVKVTINADHKYFFIHVSDSGIGIPEDSLDKIFERFYRVDKMRARKTGGTGLGLAITRSIVLMHYGNIRVESKEGEGTSFTIKIPLSFVPKNQ